VTAAILEGQQGLKLVDIPKLLPLSWRAQQRLLG
jgi:site-specific DNA recombinase